MPAAHATRGATIAQQRRMPHDYRAEAEAHARRAREAIARYPASDLDMREAAALALALSDLCLAFAAEDDRVRSAPIGRTPATLTHHQNHAQTKDFRTRRQRSDPANRKPGA